MRLLFFSFEPSFLDFLFARLMLRIYFRMYFCTYFAKIYEIFFIISYVGRNEKNQLTIKLKIKKEK